MAPVVLRVKRKLQEDPVNALIIYTKRARKNHDDDSEEKSKVFKFAGTIANEQTDRLSDFVQAALKHEKSNNSFSPHQNGPRWGTNPKFRPSTLTNKLRSEHQKIARQSRLEIVNSHRNLLAASQPSDQAASQEDRDQGVEDVFKLYDVIETEQEDKNDQQEKSIPRDVITVNGEPMVQRAAADHPIAEDCVYDIYYATDFDVDALLYPKAYSIEKCTYGEELEDMDYRDEDEADPDEDDSNEEDNWRNDYPDEDADFFENEYDYFRDYEDEEDKAMSQMLQARSFGLEDENEEQSSDSSKSDDYTLLTSFERDVDLHGLSYAKFKARMAKELESSDDDT